MKACSLAGIRGLALTSRAMFKPLRTTLRWPSRLAGVALLLIPSSGCGERTSSTATTPTEGPPAVTLSVAASTADAIREIVDLYQTRERDRGRSVDVKVNPGPSSSMANQILSGAPADIFLSANQKWADAVTQYDLAVRRRDLLSNRLVLIVPAGNPSNVHRLDELASRPEARLALAGEQVPAGMYADEILRDLKLADALAAQNRIVRGQSVRSVLGYVSQGEVAAGVVYATDARLTERVQIVDQLDPQRHTPIVYPLLLLRRGAENPAATELYDFFLSPPARQIFEDYGFVVEGSD